MLYPRLLHISAFAVQLLLSLFFLFVGWMKTVAPMAMLRIHHAWVADLPVAIARSVGVSELICAAALMLGLFVDRLVWWSGIAAWLLVANQLVAVAFHATRGEMAISGGQNATLILSLLFIGICRCHPRRSAPHRSKNRLTDRIDKPEYPF